MRSSRLFRAFVLRCNKCKKRMRLLIVPREIANKAFPLDVKELISDCRCKECEDYHDSCKHDRCK